MFEYWSLFNGLFLLFIFAGYAIYYIANRKNETVPEERKDELYACGERWEEQQMPSAGFYKTLIDYLRIKNLSDTHTGHVSDYLLWVFSGIVVIMMLFVVL